MPSATTPQDDAIAQVQAKALRTAQAFAAVFGQGTRRTADQRIIYEHLQKIARDEINVFQFAGETDGILVSIKAAHRDGAQVILRVIDRQISVASEAQKPKKQPPQTIR